MIDKINKGPTNKIDDLLLEEDGIEYRRFKNIIEIYLIPLNCIEHVKLTQTPKRVKVCK